MRTALLCLGAVAINLGLFLLMETMVERDRSRLFNTFEAQTIEFVRTPLEDETKTKDRRRKPPPKPEETSICCAPNWTSKLLQEPPANPPARKPFP